MIQRERLVKDFDAMAQLTAPGEGINRLAFTDADWAGRQYIIDRMTDAGLSVEIDDFGNVIAYKIGKKPDLPVVMVGSHTDSVPNGGNYDGVVGVLSAIEVIRSMTDDGYEHDHTIAVVSFMCEESGRFGNATLGSKAMRGELRLQDLYRLVDKQGISLYEALKGRNLNPDGIEEMAYKRPVKSFTEIHIEQGKVLEHEQKTIGIVTGIAAPERFYVTIRGNADHSGATPMNLRHDALCGASKIILGIEEIASMQEEPPVVGTVGVVEVTPGAMNVIPGAVKLGVDIRSISEVARNSVVTLVKEFIDITAEKRGLSYTIETIAQDHPVEMHPAMIREIEEAVKSVGVEYMTMSSGAGHDAMHWAEAVPTGMIFIPCRDGISHNPAEFTEMDDIVTGAEVLDKVLKKLSLEETKLV
ncbi:MAG: M20 family metallo-hydrolase [Veillonella parvula]|jgi:amidase, hydantoinase/carbamoylase family|uniref:M20 family metallo-hydrolase n=1 Tax=Veillonella TaxID=29465 RepID=UPI00257E68A0|nr:MULTISPECIES: M20 family metallo-hydrolase [Veillonella]MBS7010991.1 M20 family metallo-hydrolase [Veillonella sp.]MDU2646435.1 M20 family metallo-hydrolase [Veillonella parvula]MDU3191737.1 M20 family metallo-hydrolase [Veillonella parvula]